MTQTSEPNVAQTPNALKNPLDPAEIVMEHILDTYDLVPFVNSDGGLGIHFMSLCSSADQFETLEQHMIEMVEGYRNHATGSLAGNGSENVAMVEAMGRSLQAALTVVETALVQMRRAEDANVATPPPSETGQPQPEPLTPAV